MQTLSGSIVSNRQQTQTMDGGDSEWVRKAQMGDAAAFDHLVRLHEPRVLAAIAGVLGHCPEVYDVYQDTLVRVHQKLPSFRFESAFLTWVTRIAINRSLNERRRRKPDRQRPLDEAASSVAIHQGEAVSDLERAQLRETTNQALASLSDRERAVFVLKHEHGYKLSEIGAMLDCAEGTIKNYLFRATRKLRVRLEPEYREWKT